MEVKFKAGDLVIYGETGVCRVDMVGPLDMPTAKQGITYYTLLPLYSDVRIFAPVGTKVYMRPIISRQDALELIDQISSLQETDFGTTDLRQLNDMYQQAVKAYECIDMVKFIKAVYTKRQRSIDSGKKPGQADERYLKQAEDLLYGELAVALGIPKSEVKGVIEQAVERAESGAS
ncbi:MAG: CarD family transcriptional regulator [Syntrophomonadaceae bacterium]|nr:CarD family transcriptional regulator [Syntrophomonadaceae bacterium]